jgi:thiol-disulfide isomerase/thioredoxin
MSQIASIDVKTLNNTIINTSQFDNDDNLIIISFWATWCKPCVSELENIHEVYEEWQDKTNVKLIAISVDNSRSQMKVKPFVNSKGWEYEVYIDNGKLMRSMGVNVIPHTFLLNSDKEVIYSHVGYNDGDEYDLFEIIETYLK